MDGLGSIVRDFDPELFFESHNQLNSVQTVSAQIINKGRRFRHFVFFNTKMLYNNLAYAVCNVAHIKSLRFYGLSPVVPKACAHSYAAIKTAALSASRNI
ncbi:acyl carrier protein [Roseobacter sp. CCS2]|nr:acyl carrier protein [Roseobacter sp. CCS2]